MLLTTSMDGRDLARLDELPLAGLVSKPLTHEKIDEVLQLHFRRQLPPSSGRPPSRTLPQLACWLLHQEVHQRSWERELSTRNRCA